MPETDAKDQRRGDFPYITPVPTRWGDNDMLGHINNVVYQRYFEAEVVRFLMDEAGLDWLKDPVIPYAVETTCWFHRPISFPGTIGAGLRVETLGNSSVTYALALFSDGHDAPAATGRWVHVFVDRETEKPTPIPDAIRAVYQRYT